MPNQENPINQILQNLRQNLDELEKVISAEIQKAADQKLQENQAKIDQLNKDLQAHQAKIDKLNIEIASKNQKIAQLEKSLRESQKQLQEIQTKNEDVLKKMKDLAQKSVQKRQENKSENLAKILQLAQQKSVTNDLIQKELLISDKTAERYLTELVESGKLIKIGSGSATAYQLP